VHKTTASAVNEDEFGSDRMSYTILRGCWLHAILLKVHAPTRDKIVDVNELEHLFINFLNSK
jgi:hypothetical protein